MDKRILYIQYTNPASYPPLQHSSRILADAGWQVLFLGIGAHGSDALRFPPHPDITVRRLSFQPSGWHQKLHYIWFTAWVLFWVLRWQPAWVYASDVLSCPVSLLVSYFPGLNVVYHEHDPPTVNPQSASRTSRFMRWALWARRRLAVQVRLCIFPSEQLANHYLQSVTGTPRTHIVWNCPRREEVAPVRAPSAPDGALNLLYHGSISPPRLSSTVLTALSMLPDCVRLRVMGYETTGHVGYVGELQRIASELGISERIEFLGVVPRSTLLESCRECDVGLAMVPIKCDSLLRPMVGGSNKPFDYLACGLPVLVSNLPDWRATYVEPGYGLACDPHDPESIAAALRWFLEHPAEMRAMGERGRQRILQEWNYERQFQPVFESLSGKR